MYWKNCNPIFYRLKCPRILLGGPFHILDAVLWPSPLQFIFKPGSLPLQSDTTHLVLSNPTVRIIILVTAVSVEGCLWSASISWFFSEILQSGYFFCFVVTCLASSFCSCLPLQYCRFFGFRLFFHFSKTVLILIQFSKDFSALLSVQCSNHWLSTWLRTAQCNLPVKFPFSKALMVSLLK